MENAYSNQQTQQLLKQLTKFDDKFFERQQTANTNAREIRLVTNRQFEALRQKLEIKNKLKFNLIPLVEERIFEEKLLEVDEGLDRRLKNKYCFVDISLNASDLDRMVWIRDTDGSLSTAGQSDRRRLMQTIMNRPFRSTHIPEMFKDEQKMDNALEFGNYLYILQRACWQFESNDPLFHKVCIRDFLNRKKICNRTFERIDLRDDYDKLQGTRFYGTMVFYLCWNNKLDRLVAFNLKKKNWEDVEMLLKLYYTVHNHTMVDSVQKCLENYIENYANDAQLLKDALSDKDKEMTC